MTIVQIYEYFEYTISFEYISDIITNTEYNDEYFFWYNIINLFGVLNNPSILFSICTT